MSRNLKFLERVVRVRGPRASFCLVENEEEEVGVTTPGRTIPTHFE